MEKDTLVILDLSSKGPVEYTISLECFYPEDMDEKKKGQLSEVVVLFGNYKDVEAAKDMGRDIWKRYSEGGMKKLRITTFYQVPVFEFDNFKDFV